MGIYDKIDSDQYHIHCRKCDYQNQVIDVREDLTRIPCPQCGNSDVLVNSLDDRACQNGL